MSQIYPFFHLPVLDLVQCDGGRFLYVLFSLSTFVTP
jgi:hypothetical protein